MDQERATPAGQLEQGTRVGPARRPAEHEVDRLGFPLKKGYRDLTGRERFTDMAHQEVNNRSPSQGARHLLAERGQAANQIEIGFGVGELGRRLR